MKSLQKRRFRLGVDVGGTFTDIILIGSEGEILYSKTPSTPKNQSLGVLEGIRKVFSSRDAYPSEIGRIVHGTTVATNALLERKGSRIGILTTEGFKDVLTIGRQSRSELYSLRPKKPAPLVDRDRIVEIAERMEYTGAVLHALEDAHVLEALQWLLNCGTEAVAVCFLNSYANPRHEERAKAVSQDAFPQLHVTISSELTREFREYERFNATVINAYVAKTMERYISALTSGLKQTGVSPPLSIMQSNGGFMSAEMARHRSVSTLLSGPAAGVLAACFTGRLCAEENLISADMGGTSFDISLIREANPTMVTETAIGGFPIKMPVVDIHTIGAGGGSIGWIDSGGMLQVGPASAGADPGPICYGRGGREPTVTDANLLLGRLNPNSFKEYGLRLDPAAAREAMKKIIAAPLGLDIEKACDGIVRVVNAGMVRGIRVVSVEKGHDPRRFALLAFGGAGPLHARELARELRMKKVIVPVAPGNFSTLGLLTGDMKYDYVRTYVCPEQAVDFAKCNALYGEMASEAFERMGQEGYGREETLLLRSMDLRYLGQSYELAVPVPDGKIGEEPFAMIKERFHAAHLKAYGFSRAEETLEVVNLRLTSVGRTPSLPLKAQEAAGADPGGARIGSRPVYFEGRWLDTAIYRREPLRSGNHIEGPAVIEETGSTTLIFPGDRAAVDGYGNIFIELDG